MKKNENPELINRDGKYLYKASMRGDIAFYRKVEEELHWLEEAIEQIKSIVEEDMSGWDKVLIKNIAQECFFMNLEHGVRSKGPNYMDIADCSNVLFQGFALSELRRYGFKLNNKKIREEGIII